LDDAFLRRGMARRLGYFPAEIIKANECLTHRVYLVVICAIREGGAFLDEIMYPFGTWQINVPGFDKRRNGVHPGNLSALGIHSYNPRYLPFQRLDDRGSIGLVFDQ